MHIERKYRGREGHIEKEKIPVCWVDVWEESMKHRKKKITKASTGLIIVTTLLSQEMRNLSVVFTSHLGRARENARIQPKATDI